MLLKCAAHLYQRIVRVTLPALQYGKRAGGPPEGVLPMHDVGVLFA